MILRALLILLLLGGTLVNAQADADDPFAEPTPTDDSFDEDTPTDSSSPENLPLPSEPLPDGSETPPAPPSDDPAAPDSPAPDSPTDGVPAPNTPPEDQDIPEDLQGVPLPDAPLPDAPLPDAVPDAPFDAAPSETPEAPQTSPDETPSVPSEGSPTDGVPFPDAPFDPAPAEETPSETLPDDAPTDGVPAPSDTAPSDTAPNDTAPSDAAPTDGVPAPSTQEAPIEETPPPANAPLQVTPEDPAPPANIPDAPPEPEMPEDTESETDSEPATPSGPSLNLAQVLELSAQQTRVTTAQLELQEAQVNLERQRADPLGLRVALLEAEQRYERAQTRYLNAFFASARELVGAYTGLQLARQRQIRAAEALELSETLQQAAVIRQNNGSATALDVQEAQNRLELAQSAVTQSQDALALAEARLRSLVGSQVGELEDLPQSTFETELPPIDAVNASAEQNPELLSAIQTSELAEATLGTLDPIYTSPAQLEAAQVEALSASEALSRARSDFQLTVQSLYDDALSAQKACSLQQISRDNARERFELQQARVESGLLSELELRELELDTLDAELDAYETCRNYLGNLLDLQANTGLDSGLISVPR